MTLDLITVGNALDHEGSPLSAAARVGEVVHTAGIVPIDPASGAVVDGDIAVQARRALENLALVLDAAGCSLRDVAVMRVYLADIAADLDGFNRVYGEFFAEHHPPRYALGVTLAWPQLRVELQAVARVGAGVGR